MMSGGIICKETVESRIAYDMAASSVEIRGPLLTKSSTSIGNVGTTSDNDVQDLLECPVCLNLMYPPIYQCPNGHTLCSTCKVRVHNCCPTCRSDLGNIRCLALEKVAESLELSCRYQILGCNDIFPYYSKLKHEKYCKYRLYNCPYVGADCAVIGDVPSLVAHLKDEHKVDMHDGCSFNHRYVKNNPQEVENATWMLTVPKGLLVWAGLGLNLPVSVLKSPELGLSREAPVLVPGLERTWFLTVLDGNFVCILRHFIWGHRLYTWRFCGSWGTKMRRSSLVTVWRLGEMGGRLYGKEFRGVFAIVIGRFEMVRMD